MDFNDIKYKPSDRVAIWDDQKREIKPQELTHSWYLSSRGPRFGLVGLWSDYEAGNEERLNPKYRRFLQPHESESVEQPREETNDAPSNPTDPITGEDYMAGIASGEIVVDETKHFPTLPEAPQETTPEAPKHPNLHNKGINDLRQIAIGTGNISPEDAALHTGNNGKKALRNIINGV